MRVIISGAGAVGMYLARMLSHFNHDIVIIDKDEEALAKVESHYDVMTIKGDSSLISILNAANISKTDLLISVTNEQDINILTCILGKQLGAKKTVARIDDSEYLLPKEQEIYLKSGIDEMIYPERVAALEIRDLLQESFSTESFHFSGNKLSLLMIRIAEDSPIVNKTLRQVTEDFPNTDFRAVAIKRNNSTLIPSGSDIFMANDKVYVISLPDSMKSMLQAAGIIQYPIEDIMIIGGTKIARKAAMLLQNNYNVKIIERDKNLCLQLAEELDKTLVINGQVNDLDLLKKEGIAEMDAFIALTENSEVNIFTTLLAKKAGVKKAISLIDDVDYIDISQNIGVDTIINKKLIAASYIYKFTMEAEVTDSKCLNGVDADVLEFVAQKESKITKKPVHKLDFPEGAIIGGVIRGEEAFIATGSTQIIADDHVVVFTLPYLIPKVEKYFRKTHLI